MRAVVRCGVVSMLLLTGGTLLAQAPKPSPEIGKFAVWVGTWTYQGEAKATPFSPAAKISGTQTGRMTVDGFAFEWKGEEKGAFGPIQWAETDVYDAATKSYPYLGYQTDGTTWSGSNAIVGNAWRATGSQTVKGTAYKVRGDATPSADGKSWTLKQEISADGKTWMPWTEIKLTKSARPQS